MTALKTCLCLRLGNSTMFGLIFCVGWLGVCALTYRKKSRKNKRKHHWSYFRELCPFKRLRALIWSNRIYFGFASVNCLELCSFIMLLWFVEAVELQCSRNQKKNKRSGCQIYFYFYASTHKEDNWKFKLPVGIKKEKDKSTHITIVLKNEF